MSDLNLHNPPLMTFSHSSHERPVWIWEQDTASFIWANSEGVKFWAAHSLERLQAMPFDKTHPAWRAICSAVKDGIPEKGLDLQLHFPGNKEGYQYAAICRCGKLQEKSAIIVELIGAPQTKNRRARRDEARAQLASTAADAASPQVKKPVKNGSHYKKLNQLAPSTEDGEKQFNRPAKQSLDELAVLIQQAKDGLNSQHPSSFEFETASQSEHSVSAITDEDVDVDLTALSGVDSQDQLQTILNACSQPVALMSLQTIIYANPEFISEFGYGDLKSLISDGSDWLFPNSRTPLRQRLEDQSAEPEGPAQIINHIRLRSGRKIRRDVLILPIKLIKFDRRLLLVQLSCDFHPEQPGMSGHEHAKTAIPDLNSIPLMSAISHEVRTPLNVIIGFSELMDREQFGPLGHEKYQGYVKDIYNSAQHALSLINDLLDLTKLRAGKWELDKKQLEVNDIVRAQVSLMRELAAKRSIRLRSELEENLPLIMADERALQQILLNLLSNAVKYNQEGGGIRIITERRSDQQIRLQVIDTGRGMNNHEIAQALEPFKQLEGIEERRLGSGLGLPIAKALADANDIGFTIKSEKKIGTTITLTFKT